MKKRFFLTFDVDYQPGTENVIPEILKYLKKKDIESTFFITGKFAKENPKEVNQIALCGHGLGVHGWDHGFNSSGEDFYKYSLEEQTVALKKAKQSIVDACGVDVVMNRNPNLWMNQYLWEALEKNNIHLDSSVPAFRFFGQLRNIKNSLTLPRAYKIKTRSEFEITELPPTAFIFPFNTSLARFFGHKFFLIFQKILSIYSQSIVLYTHPAELMTSNDVTYDDNELARYKKNTGPKLYDLLDKCLLIAKKNGYEFCKMDVLLDEK